MLKGLEIKMTIANIQICTLLEVAFIKFCTHESHVQTSVRVNKTLNKKMSGSHSIIICIQSWTCDWHVQKFRTCESHVNDIMYTNYKICISHVKNFANVIREREFLHKDHLVHSFYSLKDNTCCSHLKNFVHAIRSYKIVYMRIAYLKLYPHKGFSQWIFVIKNLTRTHLV